jgi:nitric oxide reductase subunit B
VKSVGFAVFWGISLVWLSGLLGNAHHYFWIGTPEFWQFWGSLFSALEPLPLIFCFWHVYLDAHQDNKPLSRTCRPLRSCWARWSSSRSVPASSASR